MKLQHILVCCDTATQYGRGVIGGLTQFARTRPRWLVQVIPPYTDSVAWQLDSLAPAGIICRGQDESPWFALAQRRQIPTVMVSHNRPFNNVVMPDYRAAGRMGVRHLLERGYRHLAFRGAAILYSQLMEEGCLEAASAARVDCAVFNLTAKPLSNAQIIEQQLAWLQRLPRPLGILCAGDDIAVKVLHSIRVAGYEFGRDVALLGIQNDTLLCESCTPLLSSIAIPQERIGYEAAEQLDQLIRGGASLPAPRLLPPTRVVVRGSSDLAATDDLDLARAADYIRRHLRQRIGVEDVARHVNLSRRTLERRFARHLHHSVDHEIRRQRIEQAKQLLVDTDLSQKRISAMCGFTRPEYLSHTFRKLEGLSPVAYRKRHTLPL